MGFTAARFRKHPAIGGQFNVRAFDQAVGDRHGKPAGEVVVARAGVTQCCVARADDDRLSGTASRPRFTLGSDGHDAFQHLRDRR